MIEPGKYRHYSGKLYRVIGVGRNSETLEEMVVYQALYDSAEFGNQSIWVRPLAMFMETVEVNGHRVSRFKRIQD